MNSTQTGPALFRDPTGQLIHTRCWISVNGKLHREDGPALIQSYADGTHCTQRWYQNGKPHREDGPAIVYPRGKRAWRLHGMKIRKKDFDRVYTCPLEELPELFGTPYECIARKRLEAGK